MFFNLLFVLIVAGFQCLGLGITDQKNLELELGNVDRKNVGLGIQDQKKEGLKLGTNVGIDGGLDLAIDFKLRLLTGLKATGIFESYSGAIYKNQLYVVSRLLIQLLSTQFGLQLDNSYVASCFKKLSGANVSLSLDAYLDPLADFTSQLLVQNELLSDMDVALRNSCESIILACSRAFNLNIDISAAVDIALIAGVGLNGSMEVGAGTDIGLEHGERVTAGGGLNDDVLVKIAKKFGCILKSSEDFDLAVLLGDRKSVFRAIIPAVRGSLGVKAAIALAHCVDVGINLDHALGTGIYDDD